MRAKRKIGESRKEYNLITSVTMFVGGGRRLTTMKLHTVVLNLQTRGIL